MKLRIKIEFTHQNMFRCFHQTQVLEIVLCATEYRRFVYTETRRWTRGRLWSSRSLDSSLSTNYCEAIYFLDSKNTVRMSSQTPVLVLIFDMGTIEQVYAFPIRELSASFMSSGVSTQDVKLYRVTISFR